VRIEPADAERPTVAYPRFAAATVAVLLVAAVVRVVAVFTENVNWDELALLERAVHAVRTGEVVGGGRPGLGTLVLMPFARECQNALEAVVGARVLWTAFTAMSAAVWWLLLRSVLGPSPYRWLAATTGLALWVLSPPVLRFSIQVRTDQPAVLFGLLGGLALVASRRRPAWAMAAGILFGAGFLFSQKLLYVGGLVGILAAGQLLVRGEWVARREVFRVLSTALTFVAVVLTYRLLVAGTGSAPTVLPVSGAMTTFEHYREVVGWRFYRGMLPVLVPQLLAVGGLIAATAWAWRARALPGEIVLGWLVLSAGIGVAWFHAGRFPYFFIVLGLFPAALGAMVVAALDRIPLPLGRAAMLVVLWLPLVGLAMLQSANLLEDTQRHQRDTLAFVERSFAPDARGFNSRAAFACRQDPDPFPVRFLEHVRRDFGGPDGIMRSRELMAEFRQRPVVFMIPPIITEPYPEELWYFWRTRYVQYHGAVHVPGTAVRGPPDWTGDFEAVVPADYRWHADRDKSVPLVVNGQTLLPGQTVALAAGGPHSLSLPMGGAGVLALAVPEPPAPDTTPFFRGF
jgi:hypothetical protein